MEILFFCFIFAEVFLKFKIMSATVVRIPTSDNTISAELQNKIDKAMKEYENGETLHFENISEMNQWLDAL